MSKIVNVTLSFDASFNYAKKKGGYAFYLEVDKEAFKIWGGFDRKVGSPLESELRALINSLEYLKSMQLNINNLTIITDNSFIHTSLFKKAKKRKFLINSLRNTAVQHISNLNYESLNIEKVKAHKDEVESYSEYINNWCDEMSKKGSKLI